MINYVVAFVFVWGCSAPTTIQTIPIERLEPAKHLITVHHQSTRASALQKQPLSKGDYGSLFFGVIEGPPGSHRLMRSPSEVVAFVQENRAKQPVDGILLALSNPEMYSARDLMVRKELVLLCSSRGILVFVQERWAVKPQLYQALPFGPTPRPALAPDAVIARPPR
ncbi:MAG TPA: hypothetical protein VJ505_00795 [Holophagaceae bacterium]|nr:hypothetical protein [Holophagaceae bacterium]